MSAADPTASRSLACVILAHGDPDHLQRLVAALDPFPVFLHVDVATPREVFERMTRDLPARVQLLPRIRTGWARWENVEAELEGYRRALASTGATHVALMTGSDYPLASSEEIAQTLAAHAGQSFSLLHPFPHPHWGQNGGRSRVRYPHWVVGKRMIRVPVPRRLPTGVVFAGGSQLKVLSREHASALLETVDAHPELVKFWRRSWIADETFVPSILSTPEFVPGWEDEHVREALWWIGWSAARTKSPPWLTESDSDAVLSRRRWSTQAMPSIFARKFSTDASGPLLDAIDESRARGVQVQAREAS